MTTDTQDKDQPKPTRKFVKIYVVWGSVFLLVLLLGLFSFQIHKRHVAVEAIQNLGGDIAFEDPPSWIPAWAREPYQEWICKIYEVDLKSSRITNDDLVYLKSLTNLEMLYLRDNQITDDGLVHLKSLAKLEHLDLARSVSITLRQFSCLFKLPPAC